MARPLTHLRMSSWILTHIYVRLVFNLAFPDQPEDPTVIKREERESCVSSPLRHSHVLLSGMYKELHEDRLFSL